MNFRKLGHSEEVLRLSISWVLDLGQNTVQLPHTMNSRRKIKHSHSPDEEKGLREVKFFAQSFLAGYCC